MTEPAWLRERVCAFLLSRDDTGLAYDWQNMLRWGVQHGRSVIPKSTKPHRIAENIDVFDFELSDAELKAIDDLDTGARGGPEPADVNLENFGRPIPEA